MILAHQLLHEDSQHCSCAIFFCFMTSRLVKILSCLTKYYLIMLLPIKLFRLLPLLYSNQKKSSIREALAFGMREIAFAIFFGYKTNAILIIWRKLVICNKTWVGKIIICNSLLGQILPYFTLIISRLVFLQKVYEDISLVFSLLMCGRKI